jgi:hypothetical protein
VRPQELARVEPGVEVRLGDSREPLRERPLRAGVVLRLDGEQASNGLAGAAVRFPDEPLRPQPAERDRGGWDGQSSPASARTSLSMSAGSPVS